MDVKGEYADRRKHETGGETVYIGIDLGSTNIKAAIYDDGFGLLDRQSRAVCYIRENGYVEFDPCAYYDDLVKLLADMLSQNGVTHVCQIALTGQAESLVVLDAQGNPLMNGISWMDDRSGEACEALRGQFSPQIYREITGQQAVLPTWPATKILWLREHRPQVFRDAECYMLLKDYVVYRLTGKKLADMSIATFTLYFDIYGKRYWKEMLDAIGITERQLPPLCEPCTVAGPVLAETAQKLGIDPQTQVNVGALDHFAGMIGTGNVEPGGITLSTGTVMAMAAMCADPVPRGGGIAMHYGFLPNTYVMLPVAESGGISLEWFHRTCMPHVDYEQMDEVLAERGTKELLFLPYLVGSNAPEFDAGAKGVFWGLRQEHDAIDMAGAVMEGVSFVLRKNCQDMEAHGGMLREIVATGGGAKSPVWCQMQADITGLPVRLPKEKEAACLGAAMIAAVADGHFCSYDEAVEHAVETERVFYPNPDRKRERKYRQFCRLYQMSLEINAMD